MTQKDTQRAIAAAKLIQADQSLNYVTFFADDGRLIMTFSGDGTVDLGDGLTPNEAGMEAARVIALRFPALFGEAIANEREACAKIADDAAASYDGEHGRSMAYQIRNRIRARST